jgi:L-threonylcarbamoyladenylate synthase
MTDAVAALRAGRAVVLPTDTVYGLAASAVTAGPVEALYALKGRELRQPSALLCADLEQLFEALPQLDDRAIAVVRALLPGPYTLIFANPGRRFSWLTGETPDAIGVRVPALPPVAARVVAEAGCVAATSANLPGGPDPCRVEDVPRELRDRVAAVVDAGTLPGTPSTVIDFSGREPRVVREGAASSAEAIERASQ